MRKKNTTTSLQTTADLLVISRGVSEALVPRPTFTAPKAYISLATHHMVVFCISVNGPPYSVTQPCLGLPVRGFQTWVSYIQHHEIT